jgi:hypothetical protein
MCMLQIRACPFRCLCRCCRVDCLQSPCTLHDHMRLRVGELLFLWLLLLLQVVPTECTVSD